MSYHVIQELQKRGLPLTEENINAVSAELEAMERKLKEGKVLPGGTIIDDSEGSTTFVKPIGSKPGDKVKPDDPNLNSLWQKFKNSRAMEKIKTVGYNALTKGGSKAVDFVKQHGAAMAGLTGLGGAAAVGLGAYGLYKGAKALFGKKVKPEETTYPPPPTDEYIYKPEYPTAPPYRPEAYRPAYPYYPNQSAPMIPYPEPTMPNNPQAIRPM